MQTSSSTLVFPPAPLLSFFANHQDAPTSRLMGASCHSAYAAYTSDAASLNCALQAWQLFAQCAASALDFTNAL